MSIDKTALVAIDSFNFQGEQGYRYWRCNPPDFDWGFPFAPGADFTEVTNERLAAFAQKYGVGHEFLVLSGPKELEMESGMVYETEL